MYSFEYRGGLQKKRGICAISHPRIDTASGLCDLIGNVNINCYMYDSCLQNNMCVPFFEAEFQHYPLVLNLFKMYLSKAQYCVVAAPYNPEQTKQHKEQEHVYV